MFSETSKMTKEPERRILSPWVTKFANKSPLIPLFLCLALALTGCSSKSRYSPGIVLPESYTLENMPPDIASVYASKLHLFEDTYFDRSRRHLDIPRVRQDVASSSCSVDRGSLREAMDVSAPCTRAWVLLNLVNAHEDYVNEYVDTPREVEALKNPRNLERLPELFFVDALSSELSTTVSEENLNYDDILTVVYPEEVRRQHDSPYEYAAGYLMITNPEGVSRELMRRLTTRTYMALPPPIASVIVDIQSVQILSNISGELLLELINQDLSSMPVNDPSLNDPDNWRLDGDMLVSRVASTVFVKTLVMAYKQSRILRAAKKVSTAATGGPYALFLVQMAERLLTDHLAHAITNNLLERDVRRHLNEAHERFATVVKLGERKTLREYAVHLAHLFNQYQYEARYLQRDIFNLAPEIRDAHGHFFQTLYHEHWSDGHPWDGPRWDISSTELVRRIYLEDDPLLEEPELSVTDSEGVVIEFDDDDSRDGFWDDIYQERQGNYEAEYTNWVETWTPHYRAKLIDEGDDIYDPARQYGSVADLFTNFPTMDHHFSNLEILNTSSRRHRAFDIIKFLGDRIDSVYENHYWRFLSVLETAKRVALADAEDGTDPQASAKAELLERYIELVHVLKETDADVVDSILNTDTEMDLLAGTIFWVEKIADLI
ncbi:hypothetical protein ACFLRA_01005 [Bdellovibrionota bacterium]